MKCSALLFTTFLSTLALANEPLITVPGLVNVNVSLTAAQWDRASDVMNEIDMEISTTDKTGKGYNSIDVFFERKTGTVRTGLTFSETIKISPRIFKRRLLSISAKELDIKYDPTGFDWADIIPYAIESASSDRIAKNETFDLYQATVAAQSGSVTSIKRELKSKGLLEITVSADASEKLTLTQIVDRAHANCAELEKESRYSRLTPEAKKLLVNKTGLLLELVRENGAGEIGCANIKLP
jgi:hypothetical protein